MDSDSEVSTVILTLSDVSTVAPEEAPEEAPAENICWAGVDHGTFVFETVTCYRCATTLCNVCTWYDSSCYGCQTGPDRDMMSGYGNHMDDGGCMAIDDDGTTPSFWRSPVCAACRESAGL
jgi:hypothetical protein